jgi:hypothetical protein
VTKGDALEFHHPVDRPAADLAAEAVPQVLCRRDDQAGGVVFVEGAACRQILAQALELQAGRLDQALHADFSLEPLDV